MRLEKENVQKELTRFGKYVVQQSRSNLSKKDKNVSSKLYNSIGYESKANPNSFEFSFKMEDYGKFQDKGVKGKDPSKVSKNAKIKGQQAPQSDYKFGSGNFSGTWGSFVGSIQNWAKKKNIRLRDEKGKYKKGDYKTIAQIIAGNIYNRGIKPSLFFTRPFNLAFEKLPDDLIKAYGDDLDNFLNNILNDN